MRSARGFTLMEVLVALVLLTLFAIVSYRALDAVLDSQQRMTGEMKRWNKLAAAFARMESDLSDAVAATPRQDPIPGGFHVQLESDGGAGFDLVRLLPEDADGGLQRVGYRCAQGTLTRRVWPDADDPDSTPKESTMLDGLGSCAFSYLGERGEWLAGWQPQKGIPLPRAVELRIGTADGIPIRRVWRVQ